MNSSQQITITLILGFLLHGFIASAAVQAQDAAEQSPADEAFANPDTPYTYLIAADPQLLLNQKDARYWKRMVQRANDIDPDFMIVLGDLIHGPNDPDEWQNPDKLQQCEHLADLYLDRAEDLDSDIELYNLPGNHDVSLNPTRQRIDWYEQRFGRAWYHFEHKNSLFVVLESNLLRTGDNNPTLAKEQIKWLRKTLEETSGTEYRHKTVYMHHPLCVENVNEEGNYYNLPRPKRETLLDLFHEHGFDAVFSGHYHANARVKDGELDLFITGSCCVPMRGSKRGYRIVTVYRDRIEHEYVSLKTPVENVIPQKQQK